MSEQFGDAFRRARREKKQTQVEAAELFDVSSPTIFRWEKGSYRPSQAHYPALALYLGVSERDVWDLMSGKTADSRMNVLEARILELEAQLAELIDQLRTDA